MRKSRFVITDYNGDAKNVEHLSINTNNLNKITNRPFNLIKVPKNVWSQWKFCGRAKKRIKFTSGMKKFEEKIWLDAL